MSLQSEAVKRRVKHVGAVRCDICDTCAALVLREFDPDKGGDAK